MTAQSNQDMWTDRSESSNSRPRYRRMSADVRHITNLHLVQNRIRTYPNESSNLTMR